MNKTTSLSNLFTIQQLAAKFKVDPYTVRRWIWSGLLPSVRVGHSIMIDSVDIPTFIRNAQKTGVGHRLNLNDWSQPVTKDLAVNVTICQPGIKK